MPHSKSNIWLTSLIKQPIFQNLNKQIDHQSTHCVNTDTHPLINIEEDHLYSSAYILYNYYQSTHCAISVMYKHSLTG